MSEHEGFCVPLVEAMFFNVPIVAYSSSAIPDTLGGSGVLVKDKDPVFVSMVIDRLVKDADFREAVIEGQKNRLKDFSYETVRSQFIEGINRFINR
jgi:glycosyltransferase involved in cell wall biosynthesis